MDDEVPLQRLLGRGFVLALGRFPRPDMLEVVYQRMLVRVQVRSSMDERRTQAPSPFAADMRPVGLFRFTPFIRPPSRQSLYLFAGSARLEVA